MAGGTSEAMTGPVTIGGLSREGKLLELGCLDCSRVVYVAPRSLGMSDSQPIPRLARRLKCSRCGAKNTPIHHPIWARPDARVQLPGFDPAASSQTSR